MRVKAFQIGNRVVLSDEQQDHFGKTGHIEDAKVINKTFKYFVKSDVCDDSHTGWYSAWEIDHI